MKENSATNESDYQTKNVLIAFRKDGKFADLDIVDGKLHYEGDLPISDAARCLFEWLADNIPDYMIERFGHLTAIDNSSESRT